MKIRNKNNRGFTLLEIMMTVALLGIFFSVTYNFLNYNLRFLNQRNEEHSSYQQARIAMFRVTNLLCRYEKLNVDNDAKVVSANGEPVINFQKNTGDITGYKYYFYWDIDKNIGQLRNSSGKLVADGINDFNFRYVSEEEYSYIKITIQAILPDDPMEPGLTLSTFLRDDRSYNP